MTLSLFWVQLAIGQSKEGVQSYQRSKEDLAEISIYPNPVNDVFSVAITLDIGEVRVYNILGREVSVYKTQDNKSFDAAHLKRGIYIVRIFDKQEQLIKALRMSKT